VCEPVTGSVVAGVVLTYWLGCFDVDLDADAETELLADALVEALADALADLLPDGQGFGYVCTVGA
jgi:hypothetical protein